MATTPQLSPKQNERLRTAMTDLYEHEYQRNATWLAKALGLRQPTITEFLRGRGGASYDTAKRVATLTGKTVDALIGPDERKKDEILLERPLHQAQFRDSPGYLEALQRAFSERPDWSPVVWESVARERVRPGKEDERVTVEDLLEAGERFRKSEVKLIKRGDVLSAPAPAMPAPPKTPYRRYMSDVRRLAVIGSPRNPSSRNMKVR